MQLIFEIGGSLLFEILQILLGCLIAYGLFKALNGENELVNDLNKEIYLIPILASILGMALPMGLFGIIPIMLSAFLIGLRFPLVVPMMVSNFLFNMLVPFTEVGFSWRTIWLRIIIALIMGVAAGVITGLFKVDTGSVLRGNLDGETAGSKRFLSFVNQYLNKAGVFLIIGLILEVIFKKYFFYNLFNLIDITGMTTVILGVIKGYDVASPVFLFIMVIFYMVMNLKTLSAVIMLFKWKSTVGFYLYYVAWVVILSIINVFLP